MLVTKYLSDVNHKQNPKQAKANEVCRVEKTLCYQSDLDLTCSFVGCVWSKRTIIILHRHLMDQHNVPFFCDFSEDAEVFPKAEVTDWGEASEAEVTGWGEASPGPDSTKESTEE